MTTPSILTEPLVRQIVSELFFSPNPPARQAFNALLKAAQPTERMFESVRNLLWAANPTISKTAIRRVINAAYGLIIQHKLTPDFLKPTLPWEQETIVTLLRLGLHNQSITRSAINQLRRNSASLPRIVLPTLDPATSAQLQELEARQEAERLKKTENILSDPEHPTSIFDDDFKPAPIEYKSIFDD